MNVLSDETMRRANELRDFSMEKGKEISNKVAKLIADELCLLSPELAKATQVTLYRVLSSSMADLWIDVLLEVKNSSSGFPDPALAEMMKNLTHRQNAKMISSFMTGISETCKKGVADGET
jgi:hypothetical protein